MKEEQKDFTITSFQWRKEIRDSFQQAGCVTEDDASIYQSLLELAQFLQDNNLLTRTIVRNGKLIAGTSFELRSSDLTKVGLEVIRSGFGKWEKMGCPAGNLKPLKSALAQVKKGGNEIG